MSSKEFPILITSAGRRVELLNCFRRAAQELNVGAQILACDLHPDLSAACNAADGAFRVPHCSSPEYVETVLDIVRQNGVKLVVPTIDPELMPLAKASSRFTAEGARVHVSCPEVVAISQDKIRTANVLSAAGLPVPTTLAVEDVRRTPGVLDWPAFLKPVFGSASRGIRILNTPTDLPDSVSEPMLIQDLLRGPEYTINIFVDTQGMMRTAVVHRRLQVRAGEVEKGRTVRYPDLQLLARRVAAAIPDARGVLCFQIIDDEAKGPMILEINARFGGGYPLVERAGASFCKWLIEEALGRPCSATDYWRDGETMLRYDAAIFTR